ncbi:MAG: hypothetical protein WCK35_11840, partial [Chloroflexota bacterium]
NTVSPELPTNTAMPTARLTETATLVPTKTPIIEPSATLKPTVEATLSPEENFVSYMNKSNISSEEYEIKGNKVYKARSTTVIYDMSTHKFSYDFAFYIASLNCEETGYRYTPGTNIPLPEFDQSVIEYAETFLPLKGNVSIYPIRPSTCWVGADKSNLYWKGKNDDKHKMPIEGEMGRQGKWIPVKK